VSCIIAEKSLDDAARAIHAEFFGQAVTKEKPSTKRGAAKKSAKKRAARA
jgi:hypothetical protein